MASCSRRFDSLVSAGRGGASGARRRWRPPRRRCGGARPAGQGCRSRRRCRRCARLSGSSVRRGRCRPGTAPSSCRSRTARRPARCPDADRSIVNGTWGAGVGMVGQADEHDQSIAGRSTVDELVRGKVRRQWRQPQRRGGSTPSSAAADDASRPPRPARSCPRRRPAVSGGPGGRRQPSDDAPETPRRRLVGRFAPPGTCAGRRRRPAGR